MPEEISKLDPLESLAHNIESESITPQLSAEMDQVRKDGIADGQVFYDQNGKFLHALAPNGKPSHLSEKQWLLSRTPSIKNWLRWEDISRQGRILEQRNLGNELERIKTDNPVAELRVLASALGQNEPQAARSNLLYFDGTGSSWTIAHVLDTSKLTGKIIMTAQNLILPPTPPEDVFRREQVDVDETILHERVHYYTTALLALYERFSKDGNLERLRELTSDEAVKFAQRVEDLFRLYKEQDGYLNIHEFLAYGLTNARTQARDNYGINPLKRMKYTGEKLEPTEIVSKELKQVGVEDSLYNELFTTFVNYYSQIEPRLYSDQVDQNGDPIPEHVATALARFRHLQGEQPLPEITQRLN